MTARLDQIWKWWWATIILFGISSYLLGSFWPMVIWFGTPFFTAPLFYLYYGPWWLSVPTSILHWVGITAFSLPLIGFFFEGSYTLFPLDRPVAALQAESLAVDSEGNIYLAIGYFGRIQKHGPAGNFIKAWPITASGNHHYVNIIGGDQIQLRIPKGRNNENTVIRYDLEGNLISQKTVEKLYIDRRTERVVKIDGETRRYILFSTAYMPRVLMQIVNPEISNGSADQPLVNIITSPTLFFLLPSIIGGWCLFAISILLGIGLERLNRAPLEPKSPEF